MLSIDPAIQTIRLAWCDLHGQIRSKSLPAKLVTQDLSVGMVGTLMLKDTSDHTAFKVFEPSQFNQWSEAAKFANASNMVLKLVAAADAPRLHPLPWSPREAWLFAEPFFVMTLPLV